MSGRAQISRNDWSSQTAWVSLAHLPFMWFILNNFSYALIFRACVVLTLCMLEIDLFKKII